MTKVAAVKVDSYDYTYHVASSQQTSQEGFLGDLFMVGAAMSWVVYTLITRPLSTRYS